MHRLAAFGAEYGLFERWPWWQRAVLLGLGSPDVSSRARFLALRRMLPQQATRILDLGCGNGLYCFFLSRMYAAARIVGCDLDRARIEAARSVARRLGLSRVEFTHGDILQYLASCEAHRWDLVLAIESLQYVDDVTEVLRQVHRGLKPGGTLVLHVPLRESLEAGERVQFTWAWMRAAADDIGFKISRVFWTRGRFHDVVINGFERARRVGLIGNGIYPIFGLLIRLRRNEYKRGKHLAVVLTKGQRVPVTP